MSQNMSPRTQAWLEFLNNRPRGEQARMRREWEALPPEQRKGPFGRFGMWYFLRVGAMFNTRWAAEHPEESKG